MGVLHQSILRTAVAVAWTLAILAASWLQAQEAPKARIPAEKEPTSITGPVDGEGYLDYEEVLNNRLSKGVTAENNANVLIWQALGPTPQGAQMPDEFFRRLGIPRPGEQGKYFISSTVFLRQQVPNAKAIELDSDFSYAGQRPWGKDYLHVASWLKANDAPLAILVEATRRPEYYNPLIATREKDQPGLLLAAQLPAVQSSRDMARALTARAMLHVRKGNFTAAWQDLLACYRLGRLVGRGGTLIEGLVGIAIDGIASEAALSYLEHANLTAAQIQGHLKDLQALPPLPVMGDKIDLAERIIYLQVLQALPRYGASALGGAMNGETQLSSRAERFALSLIDWKPAVKDGNRYFDKLADAMRIEDRRTRVHVLGKIADELKEKHRTIQNAVGGPGAAIKSLLKLQLSPGKTISDVLLTLLAPALDQARLAEDRAHQRIDNLRVAFALAAYRRDHGRYPEKLSFIVPKYLPEVPNDMFSFGQLVYRTSAEGYLFYSVGINGKDDGGRSYDDVPAADDMTVQMPRPKLPK